LIPESFVQELLARVDVADVVGRYVQLKKGGANLLGLCPFHNEKSPSFTVSPTKQFYHCFGCGAHGSAITFLMEQTGASFPEAVRSLAAGVGMTVPEAPRSPQAREASRRRKEEVSRHQLALESAQRFYLQSLKGAPAAIQYLKGRGLSGEVAARFGLGWSGHDRRGLATVFNNYEDPLLVEAGLVVETEDGRRYDRFRERVMFPIRNARGHLIGFGGRVIGKGEPKYLNSPETPIFSKGQELYGLWEGRDAIRREGHVLVVEGYMDVVGLAQQGIENAVATLGTATTEQHIQKLLRVADKIVFSFDGDGAGRRAAWRALQACLPLLRDDISLRFLFLPSNHDPDSFVREFGSQVFRETVVTAPALSRFMLDELAQRHNLNEAEGRAACVHEARPLLMQLPRETTLRLQIEREFARQVKLTPEELAAHLEAAEQTAREAEQLRHEAQLSRSAVQGAHTAGSRRSGAGRESERDNRSLPESYSDDTHHFEPAVGSYPSEPPGFMDDMGAGSDTPGSYAPGFSPSVPRASRRVKTGAARTRAVTPMAKRLLRLLLAHPELVDALGDQQLETLARGPHLIMVRALIELIVSSGARHAGALLQAAEPESELALVLRSISTDILTQTDLPEPMAEWNDAMHKVEVDVIRAEQSELIAAGLPDTASRERYQLLTRRLTKLAGS
tara:strand:- start:53541 stop:55571 length:2031 start_codon:yes stop_codon:yes gene_type:complete